jgi:hypothetical protein
MVTKSQKTLDKIEKEIANIFSLDSEISMEVSTNRILEANNTKYSTFTVEFKQVTQLDNKSVYDYNNMTLYGHHMEALEALAKKNGFEQNSTNSAVQIVNGMSQDGHEITATKIIHRIRLFYCTKD